MSTDHDSYQYIVNRLNRRKFLKEHRLYKTEQLSFSMDTLRVRNCLNWIMRLNNLIKNFNYSFLESVKYSKNIGGPFSESDNKDWYSFHLENSVYRLITMWDVLGQLINEFYMLGEKKDDVSIWVILRKSKLNPEIEGFSKRINNYLNRKNHEYVRNYLRNTLSHSLHPHQMNVFHYPNEKNIVSLELESFSIPDHPLFELDNILEDFCMCYLYAHEINERVEQLIKEKCMFIEVSFRLPCGAEIKESSSHPISLLDTLKENAFGISLGSLECKYNKCENYVPYDGQFFCNPTMIAYHRINESQNVQIINLTNNICLKT